MYEVGLAILARPLAVLVHVGLRVSDSGIGVREESEKWNCVQSCSTLVRGSVKESVLVRKIGV